MPLPERLRNHGTFIVHLAVFILVFMPVAAAAGDVVIPGNKALPKLENDLKNIGFPTTFIKMVISKGVKVKFTTFERGGPTALYDPGSDTLKLDKSFLNGAGKAVKGLNQFANSDAPKIGEVVHELFHAYVDFFGVSDDLKYDQENIYNKVVDVNGKTRDLDPKDAAIIQEEHMAVWVGDLTGSYINLLNIIKKGPSSKSALSLQAWKNGVKNQMKNFDRLLAGPSSIGYVDVGFFSEDIVKIDYNILGAEKKYVLNGVLPGIINYGFLKRFFNQKSAEHQASTGAGLGNAGNWDLPPQFVKTDDGQWFYTTPDNDYTPVKEIDEERLRQLGITTQGQREQLGLGSGGGNTSKPPCSGH